MSEHRLIDISDDREQYPMAAGLLNYFPDALAYVAHVSKIGNDQHNPGQPMHWARGKSTNHPDKILRHQMSAGTEDKDGVLHSGKVAWRALAQLQEELERMHGLPLPRNARAPEEKKKSTKLAPKAGTDDWVAWRGGKCPVKKDTLVDVQFRDGSVHCGLRALDDVYASHAFWKRDGMSNDITAYRIVRP